MTHSEELSDEQARWLTKVLESRPRKGAPDQFVIPDAVHDALVEQGLIRWHQGHVEITLEGIRAVARRPPE
jgi:hypothetical protein